MTRARRHRGAEARSWPVVVASLAGFVLLLGFVGKYSQGCVQFIAETPAAVRSY